ncbi:hypothetical protein [Natronobacterium lacisalsi]|nr:hypothetical protein [Halobiforma lacisalsi]
MNVRQLYNTVRGLQGLATAERESGDRIRRCYARHGVCEKN